MMKSYLQGGYNLSEYIRMANAETLAFDAGDIFSNKTLPERIKYIVESHTRLKAEVERLTKAGDAMAKAIRWLPQSISDHHLDAWNAAKEGKQS